MGRRISRISRSRGGHLNGRRGSSIWRLPRNRVRSLSERPDRGLNPGCPARVSMRRTFSNRTFRRTIGELDRPAGKGRRGDPSEQHRRLGGIRRPNASKSKFTNHLNAAVPGVGDSEGRVVRRGLLRSGGLLPFDPLSSRPRRPPRRRASRIRSTGDTRRIRGPRRSRRTPRPPQRSRRRTRSRRSTSPA